MSDDFNLLINNIRTLNLLKEGDKIIIKDDNIYIEKPSYYRPLSRYFNNQTREKTNLFLIKIINKLSLELTKYYFYSINQSKYEKNILNVKNQQEYDEFLKLYLSIKESIKTLSNTYKKDKEFSRKLILNINLVDSNHPNYRKLNLLK